jgi:hypothetical protein
MTRSGDVRLRSVAVFGSSEPQEDDPLYGQAREVGSLLARAGFTVVNGGYGGVMEAASRGAREAGGRAVGVTTEAFPARGGGNRFLSEEHREPDLFGRTRRLIELSGAFIILRGKSGTLAELAFLWALNRGGLLPPTRIVLLGEFWDALLGFLVEHGMLEPDQIAITRLARTPGEAVGLAVSHLR